MAWDSRFGENRRFFALLALTCMSAVAVHAAEQRLDATVVRVIDGTSIEVSLGDRAEIVRYLGVREIRSLFAGTTAKDENERLVAGKRVALAFQTEERDERGALLAHVYVGTQLVSAELLRSS